MDDLLVEMGVEVCAMCLMNLKNLLSDSTTVQIYLPCLRSINPCKNNYQCAHSARKRKITVECIRFYRQQDGLTTMKLTNPSRRRLVAQENY